MKMDTEISQPVRIKNWVYLLSYIRQHAGLFRRRTNVNDVIDNNKTNLQLSMVGAAGLTENTDQKQYVLKKERSK
jgi:hypothetical protein